MDSKRATWLRHNHPKIKLIKARAKELRKENPYFNHATCLDLAAEEIGYDNYLHFLNDNITPATKEK